MKNVIYKMMMVIAALVLAMSCQMEDERMRTAIVGDWHYEGTDQDVDMDIWMSLSADGTFDLYQKIGEGAYWHTAGNYEVDTEAGLLTGVYDDRTPWKYDYKFTAEGCKLVMTAVQLESYSVTYNRETVPAEVVERSLELTKSSNGHVPFL